MTAMTDTQKLLYILPDVAYIAELLPGKKEHTFSVHSFRQINGEFIDENTLISKNIDKLFTKLTPDSYTVVLPDFLFTDTIVEVRETSENKVKEYIKSTLLPELDLSSETHVLKPFILNQYGQKSRVQLAAIEKSLLAPIIKNARATNTTIEAITPLSWTVKSLISLEPSISIVQMGARGYLALHYIGIDQINDASIDDIDVLAETIRTLRGAEPSIQTVYLITNELIESKLKEQLNGVIPVQQLTNASNDSDMPSYIQQIIEAGMKSLSITEYAVPKFTPPKWAEVEAFANEDSGAANEAETADTADADEESAEDSEAALKTNGAESTDEIADELSMAAVATSHISDLPEIGEDPADDEAQDAEQADEVSNEQTDEDETSNDETETESPSKNTAGTDLPKPSIQRDDESSDLPEPKLPDLPEIDSDTTSTDSSLVETIVGAGVKTAASTAAVAAVASEASGAGGAAGSGGGTISHITELDLEDADESAEADIENIDHKDDKGDTETKDGASQEKSTHLSPSKETNSNKGLATAPSKKDTFETSATVAASKSGDSPTASLVTETETRSTAPKPVIKNQSNVQPMLKMFFISVSVFVATVAIGVGIGLGFLALTTSSVPFQIPFLPGLSGPTASPTPTPTPAPTPAPTPTPEPTPAADPAEISVLVVNATTKAGYAGDIQEELETAGFEDVTARNARGEYETGLYLLLSEELEDPASAILNLVEEATELSFTQGEESEKVVEDANDQYDVVVVLAE